MRDVLGVRIEEVEPGEEAAIAARAAVDRADGGGLRKAGVVEAAIDASLRTGVAG